MIHELIILHFLKLYFDVNYPINVVLKQGKIDKLVIIDLNKQIPIFLVNIIKNVVLCIHTLGGELTNIEKSGKVTKNIIDNLRVKIIKKLDGNLDFEIFIDDNSSQGDLNQLFDKVFQEIVQFESRYTQLHSTESTPYLEELRNQFSIKVSPIRLEGYKIHNLKHNFKMYNQYNINTFIQKFKTELSLEEGEISELLDRFDTVKPSIEFWNEINQSHDSMKLLVEKELIKVVQIEDMIVLHDKDGKFYFYNLIENNLITVLEKSVDLLELSYYYFKTYGYMFI